MSAMGGRAWVAALLALMLSSILPAASGWARSTRTGPATCSHSPSARGSVVVSDWQVPDTLNPYQTGRLVTREVENALFASLFQYDNRARLVPELAATVPTVRNGGIRDGGRTIILHLRPGLRWSNGAALTARDIRFGWQVERDGATGPACLGGCDRITAIDLRNTTTAVLHLRSADSSAVPSALPDPWPQNWPGAWRADPHLAALKLGADPAFNFESGRFPTDGPYTVAAYTAGARITLRPMRFFRPRACTAPLRSLVFAFYRSKQDLITAAARSQADITTGYDGSDLRELARYSHTFRVRLHTSFTFEHLELNVDTRFAGKRNPLASTPVRQALALALDRGAVIRDALGTGSGTPARPAWTLWADTPDLRQPLVTQHLGGQWDPVAGTYLPSGSGRALADARRLLRHTRYARGFTLDFYTTTGSPERQAEEAEVASAWSKLGVRIRPNYVSPSRLLGSWAEGGLADHGAFQVALFAYLGSADPNQYRFNLGSAYCDRRERHHSTLNGNYACIRDHTIDRSFARAGRSLNRSVRAAGYNAVARQLNREAYWIPLYFRPSIATDDGKTANFSLNPTDLGPTWNIYAWSAR